MVLSEADIVSHKIVHWFNHCREFINNQTLLGGINIEVEIDESKFMHRKRGLHFDGKSINVHSLETNL